MNKYIKIFILSLTILMINVFLRGLIIIFFWYSIGFWYGLGFSYILKKNKSFFYYILFGLISQIIYFIYLFLISSYGLFITSRRFLASGITAVLFGFLYSRFYNIRLLFKDYFYIFSIGILSTALLIPAKSNSFILDTKNVLFFGKYTLWLCAFLWQLGIGLYFTYKAKRRQKGTKLA